MLSIDILLFLCSSLCYTVLVFKTACTGPIRWHFYIFSFNRPTHFIWSFNCIYL